MEYQCIEWSQLLEKKIKEKCPLCIIEWFYDKNNLQGQKKSIARVEIYLIQVIHDLYFYGKVFHFYIRIHKYKDWYVVRIFTKKSLSQKLINEYYGAAEPPVRCGESHLSGLTEPPHFVY